MKARVIATGDIVEVTSTSVLGIQTNKGIFLIEELEGIEYELDYWERLRHQYAGQAMQGLMTLLPNIGGIEGRSPKQEIVDMAIDTATALVEKLKSENN